MQAVCQVRTIACKAAPESLGSHVRLSTAPGLYRPITRASHAVQAGFQEIKKSLDLDRRDGLGSRALAQGKQTQSLFRHRVESLTSPVICKHLNCKAGYKWPLNRSLVRSAVEEPSRLQTIDAEVAAGAKQV
jgi:hypothetical protein